jgi:hypothetical protein
MARSKAQLTHAKRAREIARQEKRVRKQEKKDARKLAAADPGAETEPATEAEGGPAADTESQTP